MRTRQVRVATLVSVVGAAVAFVVATTLPASAIAHGTPVAEGQYGFATKLTMTDIPRPDGSRYNSGCSAALIAPLWVVTAGHCFHDVNRNRVSGPVPYDTKATIGRTDDADTTGHVVAVVAAYQSPTNDIAVAQLADPVYDVAPLLLNTVAPQVGDVLRITGWGALSDVNPTLATHLETGQVKVTSVAASIVGVTAYLPEPDTSACVYDSGAPYFIEPDGDAPRLVSVESNGPACPHSQEETTGRMDTVVPWITTTIGGAEPAGPRFTVAATQVCGYKDVSPHLRLRVDRVTVTVTNPAFRAPGSGGYRVDFRYWLRPAGWITEQPSGGRRWVNADLSRPGWLGQGSVVMPEGTYQASASFWVRPPKSTPVIEVVGTDKPVDARTQDPAYGTVQRAPADCTF